jgi:hypothetical protein
MASPARKLTVHQQAVLIQVLLAFPEQRVAVRYDPAVDDASSYAEDFLTIFKAIGWSVDDAAPVEPLSGQVAGLALVASEKHGLPAGAEAFRDALRIYGVEVETVADSSGCVAAGEFVLSVGADG